MAYRAWGGRAVRKLEERRGSDRRTQAKRPRTRRSARRWRARSELQMAPDLMLDLARQAAELLVGRIESLPGEDAWDGDFRRELMDRLLEDPPEEGRPAAEVIERVARDVLPFGARVDHPRCFAFVPSSPTWPAILADFIAAGYNYNVCTWLAASGPIPSVSMVTKWLFQPYEAGGLLVKDTRTLEYAFFGTPRRPPGHDLGLEPPELLRSRPAVEPLVPGAEDLDVDPDLRDGGVPAGGVKGDGAGRSGRRVRPGELDAGAAGTRFARGRMLPGQPPRTPSIGEQALDRINQTVLARVFWGGSCAHVVDDGRSEVLSACVHHQPQHDVDRRARDLREYRTIGEGRAVQMIDPAAPANPNELDPIETASRDEIAAVQLTRLRATAQHAYDNVSHYRARFDEAGLSPANLESIEDLARFPFTVKEDLRRNYPFGMFAVPRDQVIRIHASSGTTGKPTVVGYTRNDLDVWAGVVARSMRRRRRALRRHGARGLRLRPVHRRSRSARWRGTSRMHGDPRLGWGLLRARCRSSTNSGLG